MFGIFGVLPSQVVLQLTLHLGGWSKGDERRRRTESSVKGEGGRVCTAENTREFAFKR